MIWQLTQYLRNKFPNEVFYIETREIRTDLLEESVPDRCILIREVAGSETAWFGYKEQQVSFLCRDIDSVRVRSLAYEIYDYMKSRYGIIIPAVTIGVTLYPQIQISAVNPLNLPQTVGKDEENRVEFTFTLNIIWR